MGEWNGWDLNTGLALEAYGLEVGAFITEAEHLGSEQHGPQLYNYPKFSVNVTAKTNFFSRGRLNDNERVRRLEAEVTALEGTLRERTQRVERLESIMTEGGMPQGVLEELRAMRESLQERITTQEREIQRLEAQLRELRPRGGTGGGGR
jgi:predicted  nucleic acid-binding Zn-ribbon protein